MATILPVGLTYLLPTTSTLSLNTTDIVSSSGKSGPLTLKLTNSSNSAIAVVSYDNNFIPPAPVTYANIALSSNNGNCVVNITVDPADNIPVVSTIVSSDSTLYINVTMSGYGQDFGGETGFVTFNCDAVTNGDGPGEVTELTYITGYVPTSGGASATLPTEGSPTKVFTIPPLASDLVQIPASDSGSTTLVASGANVYVTPVQIIA